MFLVIEMKHWARPATLLKKRLWHRCFKSTFFYRNTSVAAFEYRNGTLSKACNFIKKNFINTFFTEHLWTTTSIFHNTVLAFSTAEFKQVNSGYVLTTKILVDNRDFVCHRESSSQLQVKHYCALWKRSLPKIFGWNVIYLSRYWITYFTLRVYLKLNVFSKNKIKLITFPKKYQDILTKIINETDIKMSQINLFQTKDLLRFKLTFQMLCTNLLFQTSFLN